MDSFPNNQSRQSQDRNIASSPSKGAAAATTVERASNVNESPIAHQLNQLNNMNDVDPSALITPVKADEQQLRARKKQLQLQLAIVNKAEPSDSKTLAKADTKRQDTKPLRWPPVSSAKSLPPLAGRMADLTKGKNDVFKKKNTIEFEVNQECEFSYIFRRTLYASISTHVVFCFVFTDKNK